MSPHTTTRDDRRTTEKVTAFLLSVLLLTSIVAPAYAVQDESAPGPNATIASQTAHGTQTYETQTYGTQTYETRTQANEHPATLPGADVTTVGNWSSENGSFGGEAIPANATTKEVTLITGQTVTVVETENRTRYRVSSDAQIHKVSTGNATYVFPDGVDFDTFDRRLFNVDLLVQQNLTNGETDSIPVIVSEDEQSRTYSSFGSGDSFDLETVSGAEQERTLDSIDAVSGTVSKTEADEAYSDLASDDSVEQVSLDIEYRVTLDQTEDAVSAEQARRDYGVSGNNVKIAVLDTGVNESHPAIDDEVVEKDFTGEGTTDDKVGHGTHVAGIIVSDNETYTGIAPNASLMDLRVIDSYGGGSASAIIDAIEYATNNDADIVSMSLGATAVYERSDDPLEEAVNAAADNGTVVVVAAGNAGPYYGTVGTPGIHEDVITVGASNVSAGELADFSSRGPTPGHHLKPDLVAPGVGVVSADHDGGFVNKSGTSMATPVVSGVAALLLEEHSTWSPQRVKSVLTTTSDPLTNGSVYAQGAGQVNATDAVGTNIVVSPGTTDFGPYTSNTTGTRIISVTNLGDANRTFDLSYRAVNLLGNGTAPVSINDTDDQITVPSGETVHLELQIDTSVPHGIYSGRVSFDDGAYTVPFGFVRAHNVTIEKESIADTSTDGDFAWLFADEYAPLRTWGYAGFGQLDGSSVTYPVVRGGTYHVITEGVNEENGTPIVMTDEFDVSGSTTHALDESDTVAYSLNTSAMEDRSGSLSTRALEVNYVKTSADGIPHIGGFSTGSGDSTTVRFLPDDGLEASIERVLVPSASAGTSDDFDGSDVYHLIHATDGVSSDRTTHVDPTALTEKRTTYYRNQRSGTYNVTLSAIGSKWYEYYAFYSGHVVTVEDGIGDRRSQSIYVNRNVSYHFVGSTPEEGSEQSWQLGGPATYTGVTFDHDPGETIDRTVNEHPYTGFLYWVINSGNFDGYFSAPQVDRNFRAYQDERNDTHRLTFNGSVVSETNTTNATFIDRVDEDLNAGTDIELTSIGRNDATSLSTRTVTTYNATYVPGEDATPPFVASIDVLDTTTNNTGDGTVRVRIVTDDDATNLTGLAATDAQEVPFDGGSGNWQEMTVERVDSTLQTNVYEASIDVNEAFGQYDGRLSLAVKATDDAGNTVESTIFDAFRVDARKPTMTVTDAGSTETPNGVSETIYTNDTVTVNFTADGTPGSVEDAGTGLSADFTNFRTWSSATRTDSGNWTTSLDLTDLTDDGKYTLETFAVDRFQNGNLTDSGVTVVLDRDAPELGATVEKAGNDGEVTLTSTESLQSDSITVTVEKPDDSTEDVSLTRNDTADGYVWEGTFALAGDGNYSVTASGADLTGNVGTTNSTAEIETVSTENETVTVILEKSGLFIEFRTDQDISSTVTITESRSALAPLSRNLAGLNFLNGELGKDLTDHLDNATIGIPVNGSNLPPGIDESEVTVGYYNESNGTWELLDTTVEERNVTGETQKYWVTEVDHFSTYGAVADDQQDPTVTAMDPDGVTLDWGTTEQTVTFDYGDDISGVNASAVELYFDGNRVTDKDPTNVTSEYATYDASGLGSGEHTAKVVVEDEAGNVVTETTTFTVETDTGAPSILSANLSDGSTLAAGTESVELTVNVSDDASGVNLSTVEIWFDGTVVTDEASVSYDEASESGNLTYTADSLSDGSSHALEAYLEDEAGNGTWHAIEFSVKSASNGGGGGGGGGGGNVPPPSVRVEILELTDTYGKAKITNARADSPGDISYDGGLAGGDVTFTDLTVTPESEDAEPRFIVEAESSGSAPSGVDALGGADVTVGYLSVTPTYISDSGLDSVTVEFDMDTSAADSPENVALYRYSGGTWSKVETKFVGKRGGSYEFEASASGTGTYAVGIDSASFEVRDATLDASSVTADEEVTVSATVENVGSGEGTKSVALVVDGETVATKEVTLASGEQTTVEFVRTFEPGEHEISVGSADAGVLTVSGETAEGGMGDDENQQTRSDGKDSNSGGIPGFGVLGALVALIGAALLARRRGSDAT
jgi:PGF-CTERM protein